MRIGPRQPDGIIRCSNRRNRRTTFVIESRRWAEDALTAYHAAGNKAPDLAMEGFVSRLDTEELKTTLTEIDQKMVELRKGRIRSRLPAEFEKKH